MTRYIGQLSKMAVAGADPVQYTFMLQQNGSAISDLPVINTLLGKNITMHFTGNINCIACKRKIPKTYQQGYCFPCTRKLAICDFCILKPDACHFHKGTCREPEWGLANCFIPHIVYLANSSGIKVGLTKEVHVPSRWIDQGATQALPILRVQSRWQAGLLESAFAKVINDKTDWRKMLRGANNTEDLLTKRNQLFSQFAPQIQQIAGNFKFGEIELLTAEKLYNFNYPVLEYPEKINVLSFDKTPDISDVLLGIRGQYLLLASGVINLRKHTGYEVCIEV